MVPPSWSTAAMTGMPNGLLRETVWSSSMKRVVCAVPVTFSAKIRTPANSYFSSRASISLLTEVWPTRDASVPFGLQ